MTPKSVRNYRLLLVYMYTYFMEIEIYGKTSYVVVPELSTVTNR